MTNERASTSPIRVIVYPDDLGCAESIDAAVRAGIPALETETAGFVRPAGLVAVAAACLLAQRSGVALTANRHRSPAANSYLTVVGFYDFLAGKGATVRGAEPSEAAPDPLTRLRELRGSGSVVEIIAQCRASLARLGTNVVDVERVTQAIKAALSHLAGGESTAIFAAERYADAAGWSRVEVGIASLETCLAESDWASLDRTLRAWGSTDTSPSSPDGFGSIVSSVLAGGPGSLDIRSANVVVQANTRTAVTRSIGPTVVGTRLGMIVYATSASRWTEPRHSVIAPASDRGSVQSRRSIRPKRHDSR